MIIEMVGYHIIILEMSIEIFRCDYFVFAWGELKLVFQKGEISGTLGWVTILNSIHSCHSEFNLLSTIQIETDYLLKYCNVPHLIIISIQILNGWVEDQNFDLL